jgi:hypothetical protein
MIKPFTFIGSSLVFPVITFSVASYVPDKDLFADRPEQSLISLDRLPLSVFASLKFLHIQRYSRFDIGLAEINLPDPSFEAWVGLLVAAAVCFGIRFERMAEYMSRHAVRANMRTVAFAALFTTTLLFFDRSQTFIYFRF